MSKGSTLWCFELHYLHILTSKNTQMDEKISSKWNKNQKPKWCPSLYKNAATGNSCLRFGQCSPSLWWVFGLKAVLRNSAGNPCLLTLPQLSALVIPCPPPPGRVGITACDDVTPSRFLIFVSRCFHCQLNGTRIWSHFSHTMSFINKVQGKTFLEWDVYHFS